MPIKDFDARLDLVPTGPGVYLMKDINGTVIYVGKAVNLRRRLQDYFAQNPVGNAKVLAMIDNIADYSYLLVRNELEALLLESNLIKRYQPFYNILLKDDHDYPYIKVSLQDEFPKIEKAYRKAPDEREGAKYYGPYLNNDVNKALKIIRKLFPLKIYHRIFQTDNKTDSTVDEIRYELGDSQDKYAQAADSWSSDKLADQSIMSKDEYREIVNDITDFLEGRYDGIQERMQDKMDAASQDLDFEKAAIWRDRLQDLLRLQEKQVAVLESNFYGDVIGLARNSVEVCIQKLEIRAGKIAGTSTYFLDAVANTDAEIITAFILQYYATASYIPKNILIPIPIAELDSKELNRESMNFDLEEFLNELAGSKVKLLWPQRGNKHDVLKMANRNAKQALLRKTLIAGSNVESIETALGLMQEILGMPRKPLRVEIYDISNTGDSDMTCGMAVFVNGKVQRKDKRVFHIKRQEAQDDYSAMQEAVERRLARLGDESFGKKPDLILADGGIGHVYALKEVLVAHGVLAEGDQQIYLAGLVKDQRHRTRGLVTVDGQIIELAESLSLLDGEKTYGSGNELGAAKNLFSSEKSENREEQLALLRLISAMQNEAHRVAGEANKKLNKKRQTKYKLEEIPGIGPAKRKALLKEFSSMKAIAEASVEELLEKVPSLGQATAENVYNHFNKN